MPWVLSSDEQARLDTHKRNSKAYYDVGDYRRAEDQCRRGLEIDEDATLRLTLGLSLLMQAEPAKLEEAAALFREEIGAFGSRDWRLRMGYGMTLQQLARLRGADPDPARSAEAPELRRRARVELEAAAQAREVPAEVPYHLAILDLEEERPDLFRPHAERALAKLQERDRFLSVQLRQPMGQKEFERTTQDRRVNSERGRRIARESARAAWRADDWKGASAAMDQLETFGALDRSDYYDRARIRERTGDTEGAVKDLERFVVLSGDRVDTLVVQSIESLNRLRAELAERRTATQLSSGR